MMRAGNPQVPMGIHVAVLPSALRRLRSGRLRESERARFDDLSWA
jgi:hypothetical protein